ncbi:response regulator [Sphingomonas sp. BIUV-7]|uniref:Response regulator n=1 Tax=Sphingomonas natans TaxID=3063330 RepID=A0ABT8YBR9_9SPHN|nr:response regulator [Sphingomonas sp. BIUV-7]MDO6415774.1 response regulator [Sphingomonas sp. BIUV-7]
MSMRKPAVLVVEDEPLILMSTIDAFEEAGFEAIDALDGEQALQRLGERPDIRAIFTDVNMPGTPDGVELANMAHALRPDLMIVVTSGKMIVSNGSLPAGGRFVAKPYRSSQVTGLFASLLH